MAETVATFILLERVAEAHMKARDARAISAESAQWAQGDLVADGAMWQVFQWLLRRYIPDPTVVG